MGGLVLNFCDMGWLEKGLVKIVVGLMDGLHGYLSKQGIMIESFFKSFGEGSGSYLAFNLDRGNIYGVFAAKIYVACIGIMALLVGLVYMYQLMRTTVSPNPNKIALVKENITGLAIGILLVGFAPYIVSAFIRIRTIILNTGLTWLGLDVSGDAAYKLYYDGASKSLLASLLLGVYVICSFYLSLIYITIALMQTFYFAFFPIIAIRGMLDRKLLVEWVRTFLLWMVIPLVDIVLLALPITVITQNSNIFLGGMLLVAFLGIRGFVYSKLGVELGPSDAAANRAFGLASGSVKKAASAIGSGVKSIGGGIAGGISNAREAKKYKELSKLDEEESDDGKTPDGGKSTENTSDEKTPEGDGGERTDSDTTETQTESELDNKNDGVDTPTEDNGSEITSLDNETEDNGGAVTDISETSTESDEMPTEGEDTPAESVPESTGDNGDAVTEVSEAPTEGEDTPTESVPESTEDNGDAVTEVSETSTGSDETPTEGGAAPVDGVAKSTEDNGSAVTEVSETSTGSDETPTEGGTASGKVDEGSGSIPESVTNNGGTVTSVNPDSVPESGSSGSPASGGAKKVPGATQGSAEDKPQNVTSQTGAAASGGARPEMDEELARKAKRDEVLRKYINVDNFDSAENRKLLSNKEMAAMYRKRAAKSVQTGVGQGLRTVGSAQVGIMGSTFGVMVGQEKATSEVVQSISPFGKGIAANVGGFIQGTYSGRPSGPVPQEVLQRHVKNTNPSGGGDAQHARNNGYGNPYMNNGGRTGNPYVNNGGGNPTSNTNMNNGNGGSGVTFVNNDIDNGSSQVDLTGDYITDLANASSEGMSGGFKDIATPFVPSEDLSRYMANSGDNNPAKLKHRQNAAIADGYNMLSGVRFADGTVICGADAARLVAQKTGWYKMNGGFYGATNVNNVGLSMLNAEMIHEVLYMGDDTKQDLRDFIETSLKHVSSDGKGGFVVTPLTPVEQVKFNAIKQKAFEAKNGAFSRADREAQKQKVPTYDPRVADAGNWGSREIEDTLKRPTTASEAEQAKALEALKNNTPEE